MRDLQGHKHGKWEGHKVSLPRRHFALLPPPPLLLRLPCGLPAVPMLCRCTSGTAQLPTPVSPSPVLQVLFYGVDERQHCIWWPLVDKQCMPGVYTLQPDFEALLSRLPPENSKPVEGNTLWHDLLAPALTHSTTWEKASGEKGVELEQSGEAVLEEAKKMDSLHVLYLGAVPRLMPGLTDSGDADKKYNDFKGRCRWMGDKFLKDL